jgi:hypothetical protein
MTPCGRRGNGTASRNSRSKIFGLQRLKQQALGISRPMRDHFAELPLLTYQ